MRWRMDTKRATGRCRHMLRYIYRVMCTVNSMHGICNGACSRSCIRRVNVRSIQWTPLLVQSKGFPPRIRCEPPPAYRTSRTGTGTSACNHTYSAWYVSRRTCCSNAALVGGMSSIVREPCANNSFHTPLAEHVRLCMTTRKLSILSRVSELTSTSCRNRSRKSYVTDGQDLHANHADFFPWPRKLDAVSHPLTAWKSIYAFSSRG